MIIVRIEHCRQLHYCSRGMRELSKRYGLDYSRFLREGMPADELLRKTENNALVKRVVEVARGRK